MPAFPKYKEVHSMRWTHEERKKKLMEVTDRDGELNAAAGADIFESEFIDYNENDELIIKYHIKPWQRNPFGNLQGGMICYYIDATAGALSWAAVDCDPVGTVDINIDFIRGVEQKTEYITVKAKVISIGRRVIVATAEVYDPEGWLMAVATTNTTRLLPPDPNPIIV